LAYSVYDGGLKHLVLFAVLLEAVVRIRHVLRLVSFCLTYVTPSNICPGLFDLTLRSAKFTRLHACAQKKQQRGEEHIHSR
jgi:hypothetical protein